MSYLQRSLFFIWKLMVKFFFNFLIKKSIIFKIIISVKSCPTSNLNNNIKKFKMYLKLTNVKCYEDFYADENGRLCKLCDSSCKTCYGPSPI